MKKPAVLKCFLFVRALTSPTLAFPGDNDGSKDDASENSGTQTQNDKNETSNEMSYLETYERVISNDFSKLKVMDD